MLSDRFLKPRQRHSTVERDRRQQKTVPKDPWLPSCLIREAKGHDREKAAIHHLDFGATTAIAANKRAA
jgi:hypothetical protein